MLHSIITFDALRCARTAHTHTRTHFVWSSEKCTSFVLLYLDETTGHNEQYKQQNLIWIFMRFCQVETLSERRM